MRGTLHGTDVISIVDTCRMQCDSLIPHCGGLCTHVLRMVGFYTVVLCSTYKLH